MAFGDHRLRMLSFSVFLFTAIQAVSCGRKEPESPLFYSDGYQIMKQVPHFGKDVLMYRNTRPHSRIIAFDVDAAENTLYVATSEYLAKGKPYISRIVKVTDGGKSELLFKDYIFDHIVDISYDWVSKNLFLIEDNGSKIVVCRTDRPYCSDLFDKRKGARSIAVDPLRGKLFWTEKPGVIYRGNMDGKISHVYLTENTRRMFDLFFDSYRNRLYWYVEPRKQLEYLDMNNFIHAKIPLPTNHTLTAWAVNQENIFWSDTRSRSTMQYCTLKNCTKPYFLGKLKKWRTLKWKATNIFSQTPHPNPCAQQPCSHICVTNKLKNTEYSCLCHRNFSLTSRTFCEISEPSFFVAANNTLISVPARAMIKNITSVEEHKIRIPRLSSMVVDDTGATLYGIDKVTAPSRLVSIDVNTGYRATLIEGSFEDVPSVHFDPLNRVLYWLESDANVVAIYNVERREVTRIALQLNGLNVQTIDLAVDFRKGLIYILCHQEQEDEKSVVVKQFNLLGELQQEMPKLSYEITQFAVDQRTGDLVVFDPAGEKIRALDVSSGLSTVLVSNVTYASQVHPANPFFFWTIPNHEGFFGYNSRENEVHHIVRDGWTLPTNALAVSGLKVLPIERAGCVRAGCSHTCIDTMSIGPLCICPEGMVLGANNETCTPAPRCPDGINLVPHCPPEEVVNMAHAIHIEWDVPVQTLIIGGSICLFILCLAVLICIIRARRSRSRTPFAVEFNQPSEIVLTKCET